MLQDLRMAKEVMIRVKSIEVGYYGDVILMEGGNEILMIRKCYTQRINQRCTVKLTRLKLRIN